VARWEESSRKIMRIALEEPAIMDEQRMDLIDKFDTAMLGLYQRALSEAGYRASRYLQMLNQRGGLETARQLLAIEGGFDGFTRLWELERLDLTVEALILEPRWRPLFTEEERQVARQRLDQYGYRVD
jgi:hypothetical protein